MAAKRKPTSQTKRRTSQKRKKSGIDEKWSILLFGIGALFLALLLVPGDSGWHWLRQNFLFGVFGVSAYLLAPLILYAALLIAVGKPALRKALAGLGVMALVSALFLVFSKTSMAGMNFNDGIIFLHQTAAQSEWGVGSGVLGSLFGWTLLTICGRPGANILLMLFLIIGLMILKGITPGDLYYFICGKAKNLREAHVQHASDRAERRTVRAQEKEHAVHIDAAKRQIAAEVQSVAAQPDEERRPIFNVDAYAPMNGAPGDFTSAARAINAGTSRIDIDLGPDIEQYKVLQDNSKVDLGPGGTFGMNPLERAKAEKAERMAQAAQSAAQTAAEMARAGGKTAHRMPAQDDVPDLQTLVRKAAGVPSTLTEQPTGQMAIVPADGVSGGYVYPPLSLFQKQKPVNEQNVQEEMQKTAELLVKTLSSFGVQTRIMNISRGPSVTRYELQPLAGVKISRITGLADDIALNLAATGVRIEAPIPGKAAVGVEVPNKNGSSVSIRTVLEAPTFTQSASPLTMALGKDIAGKNWTWDLIKMPHVLIAGSTGSGKSVCINAIIMSFLYKSSPKDVRMIMIDPKMVELSDYNGIPHLLMPVVTEAKKAAAALGSAVAEMEKRYHEFAEKGVRNIEAYNELAAKTGEVEHMPYIAIIIDELADLMMVAGKEVEDYICRIAQKARAAGMHLIVATQRPSVDVITGLIKANIPSRIAFAVSSQIDSRTILDGAGAEKLLGKGDMLFMPIGASKPTRIQGTYVLDEEIRSVQNFLKKHASADYDEAMIAEMEKCASAEKGKGEDDVQDANDLMFDKAVEVVVEVGQASTSFLQRRLKLGYGRAARIIDQMENAQIIGPAEGGAKPRQVLISRQQWIEMSMNHASQDDE